jgi:hypothetical protein
LKQLEEENRKLKRIVADLTLDKQMFQDVLNKSGEAGAQAPAEWVSGGGVPGQGAAGLRHNGFPSEYGPVWKSCPGSDLGPMRLQDLAATRVRYGYRRLHVLLSLRGREGQSQADLAALQGGRVGGPVL